MTILEQIDLLEIYDIDKITMFKIFQNKVVLITGHTGFKGSWLALWLNHLGAKVVGLSLGIPTNPSNFETTNLNPLIQSYDVDIRDRESISEVVHSCQPDFVFHLAAQALVRPSYDSPIKTIETNAMGTVNLLDSLRSINKDVVAVIITSDKVYDNVEWSWGYKETDRIGGKDPYSASKGMAEIAIRSYVESYFNNANPNVRLCTTRAGNVIGGGDWAKDRIVPDCMRAWSKNEAVNIRSPFSTRPWQHVLEPLSGYLVLAFKLSQSSKLHGEAYNFGPSTSKNYSVSNLLDEMSKHWNKVQWNDISDKSDQLHEAGLLKLNCDKALSELNWQPTLNFAETVRMTVDWYKNYYDNQEDSTFNFAIAQINEYIGLAESRCMEWASND